jgi:hypothetical protein
MISTPARMPAANKVRPARSLAAAVEARLGKVAVVDCTFPSCIHAGLGFHDAGIAYLAGQQASDPAEREFLSRFRQRGGHAGVVRLDDDDDERRALFQIVPDSGGALLCAGSLKIARHLTALCGDAPVSFLFPAALPPGKAKAPRPPGMAGFTFAFLQSEAGNSGHWLAMAPGMEEMDDADGSPAAAETVLPEPAGSHVVTARQLIHDGGHVSEGDQAYSWIWTGPARHFRFVLPRKRGDGERRIEVSVVRTESPENLADLVVQADGRPVPFTVERWSEHSGKIVFEVPPANPYTIIGLVVPKLDTDANNGRAMGLSIDKLILQPS